MPSHALTSIDPATLNAWLSLGGTVLVDVRCPSEFEMEHIAGALLIPLRDLDPTRLPTGKRIVLCCASGCRSRTAARRLGVSGLAHLEGGLGAWADAGYPVVYSSVTQFELKTVPLPLQLA